MFLYEMFYLAFCIRVCVAKNAGFIYGNAFILNAFILSSISYLIYKCVVTLNSSRVLLRGADLCHAFFNA